MGKNEKCKQNFRWKTRITESIWKTGVYDGLLLKWILKKLCGIVWTGFILRSNEPLGVNDRRGISSVRFLETSVLHTVCLLVSC
jgi:hypothetical protein